MIQMKRDEPSHFMLVFVFVYAEMQRLVKPIASRAPGDPFYFAFNDDTPTTTSSYYAHAKSVVMFNEAGGCEMISSHLLTVEHILNLA